MLHSSLYVLNGSGSQSGVPDYGERVKKFYHPADLPQALAAEMQEDVPPKNATTTDATEMSRLSTGAYDKDTSSLSSTVYDKEMSSMSTAAYDKENVLATLNIGTVEGKSSTGASRRKKNNMGRILISGKTDLTGTALLLTLF